MTERLGLGLGVSSDLGDTKSSNNFVSTWTTTGADQTVTLPLSSKSGVSYDFTINWGDGTIETVSSAAASHEFASAAEYTITVTGTIKGFTFNNSGDKTVITSITKWGTFDLFNTGSFYGCSNLDITATDGPTVSIDDLGETFRNAAKLTSIGGVSSWDTSGVTDFTQMFRSATEYNQDIGSLNVSSAEKVDRMFYGASKFNQDIGSWDTGNVISSSYMFYNAEAFNQDLSDWDIEELTYAKRMFQLANALSTTNYNLLLDGWASQSVQPNVKFHAGDATYDESTGGVNGSDSRSNLVTSGWTITDGGPA